MKLAVLVFASLLLVAPCVAAPETLPLIDITQDSGVDFVHQNGSSGTKFAIELIGPGGAVLDFDGDGDLDLYLVNGASLPGLEYKRAPENALYENTGFLPDLPPSDAGAPAFRRPFRRVADAAGAADPRYGMGAAVGDYDNDGDPDLYVTNFGRNSLYRNDGGRFVDVTDAAGVGDDRWSTSAAFVDVDQDGFLDLYVCNYFDYRLEDHGWYGLRKPGYRTHGGPAVSLPATDAFYRNLGNGAFDDALESSGLGATEPSFSLGVVAGDLDDDGDVDLYLTNDTQPNRLFLNDGSGHFMEEGMFAGVAYDQGGKPQAGMGLDAGDADGDGLVDLFCTNFSLEANTMYRGEGEGFFRDASYEMGLGEASLPFLGFGAGFLDLENDRDLDLFVANGHILDNAPLYFDNLTYEQRNQLFVNRGNGVYEEADASFGAIVTRVAASRAAIFGDLDDDGDPDLVVTNVATTPQVIRNDAGRGGWVRLILRGTRSNRDGYGAEVLVNARDEVRRFQARASYSYLASNDPRVLAGLGGAPTAEIEVRWPSGVIDRLKNVPANRAILVTEGQGGRLLPEGLRSFGWAMDEDEL